MRASAVSRVRVIFSLADSRGVESHVERSVPTDGRYSDDDDGGGGGGGGASSLSILPYFVTLSRDATVPPELSLSLCRYHDYTVTGAVGCAYTKVSERSRALAPFCAPTRHGDVSIERKGRTTARRALVRARHLRASRERVPTIPGARRSGDVTSRASRENDYLSSSLNPLSLSFSFSQWISLS